MQHIGTKDERAYRLDMVEIGRRMYGRGLVAGTDGNLSLRLPCGNILATPSGAAKGYLDTSDLVITDPEGQVIGNGRPSSELKVHLTTYQLRPEVGAVVHAHPRAAVAHSLAGVSLGETIVPETVLTLGMIAAAEYDTPGSTTLAERMEEVIRCHDAIIMERHGTLTLGHDLHEAYYRLESLEHTAQILLMARSLGHVDPLPNQEVERLFSIAEEAGVRWPFRVDPSCGSGSCELPPAATGNDRDALVNELVAKVLDKMNGPIG